MTNFDYSSPLVTRSAEDLTSLRKYAIEAKLPFDIYESFKTFSYYMIDKWGEAQLDWEWFHYEMANGFQGVVTGECSFLSVECPPQHGKSVLLTLFICYAFGINPNLQIIYATYSEDRAIQVVKEYILSTMSSEKYRKIFPHVLLKADLDKKGSDAKSLLQRKVSSLKDNEFTISSPFGKNYRGKLLARATGQGIHGVAADIFAIDDFVPNAESAASMNFRRKLTDWFYTDAVSRFQPNTKFIIVCTRWYNDDPCGLLEREAKNLVIEFEKNNISPPKFKKIRLRAQYRESDDNVKNDPRNKTGDWLWLPMLTKYILAQKAPNYNALYNCDPTETEGRSQLKETDFGYYDELPDVAGRYMFSIDGASTNNKNSDHTAIGYWFVSSTRRYLIKIWYIKKETPDLIIFVKQLLDEYKYDTCLIEFASAGVPLSQTLKKDGYNNIIQLGFSGREINSDNKIKAEDKIAKSNSKMERYLRVLPEFFYEEKRIFIPRQDIPHLKTFIQQMTTFDGVDGKADDLVDMATYLIYYTTISLVKSYKPSSNNKNYTKQTSMCYNVRNANYFIRK